MDLSIIIVAYNEEKNISSCLDSVFRLMKNQDMQYEVIVVDSLSTDRTIEISKKYNVEIIILENFRSPSTAKYIGYLNSFGKTVFFLDGDMEILMDYSNLKKCINYTITDKVAGVQGSLKDYFNGEMINHLRQVKEPTSVNFLPGSAIYYRIDLEKNNFNPNLNSNEERELGYRIKKTGFEMKILPFVMAKHKRRFNVGGLIEISRRQKNSYYLGLGQVLRANLGSPIIFLKHLVNQKVSVMFFLTFILIPISFGINMILTYSLLALHFSAILYYSARYKSISRYIDKFLQLWGILYGFITYSNKKIEYKKV